MSAVDLNFLPELVTSRLHLRAIKLEDANEVLLLRSNPQIMKYIARPLISSIKEAEAHIESIQAGIAKKEMLNWAITMKGSDKLIGIIGLYRMVPEHYRTEVGYMLLEEYQKKGITHEALQVVMDHGFKAMNFHLIEAVIDKDNTGSEKLLLKNGFVKEAHFRENYFFEGKFLDSVHYCMLRKNWRSDPRCF